MIERYDRYHDDKGTLQRLHQEDFCQALGIAPEIKYQNEGGPTLKQCVELLRIVSSSPAIDLQRFLDMVIFNVLIGNHDAHGKNFSLLYRGESTHLAPLYDAVSTAYYPELTQKMAMKIGGEYESQSLLPIHFEKLAEEAGFGKALLKTRLIEIAMLIPDALGQINRDHHLARDLSDVIAQRCHVILDRFR